MLGRRRPVEPELAVRASTETKESIAALARTEDLRFSPSGRRLAVAGFSLNAIAVLDITIDGLDVALGGVRTVTVPSLRSPHGIDFLDEDTVVVANRHGGLTIVDLPGGTERPLRGDLSGLAAPGSVVAAPMAGGAWELLVCENDGHRVTRLILLPVGDGGFEVGDRAVLLARHLDIPDGVAVSADRRWIAVSNHNHHAVMLYENSPSLAQHTDPIGVARGVLYPHGLRFIDDDRRLLVADAGAPFVHLFERSGDDWTGAHHPVCSPVMMDPVTFARGRFNGQEGGPKGVDVDGDGRVLVVTSGSQPLSFFDLARLSEAPAAEAGRSYEITLLEESAQRAGWLRHAEARARATEELLASTETRAGAAERLVEATELARATHERAATELRVARDEAVRQAEEATVRADVEAARSAAARDEADRVTGHLQAIEQTRTWRAGRLPRRVYAALKTARSREATMRGHRRKRTGP